MKKKKTSSDNMAKIKATILFSWVLLLFIANNQDVIIEAYLISISIGIISYFIYTNQSLKNKKEGLQDKTQFNAGPQGEQYLSVFFNYSQ